MNDIPLSELSYPELMRLGEKFKDHKIQDEILSRKNTHRPKVVGFKNYDKLTLIQQKILRLVSGALVQEPGLADTKTVHLNFAKHTTKGGWVTWLTTKTDKDMGSVLAKIVRLRAIVDEEKNKSGLCRLYLIPVVNEKDGWQGFKVRLDRGSRLVYEES